MFIRFTSLIVSLLVCFTWPTSISAVGQSHPELDKKPTNMTSMMPGGPQFDSSSPQKHGAPRDPPLPLNATCVIGPLSPKTWKNLSLDDFLRDYPNGNVTSLPSYAASKGLPNFDCGVGMLCSSGQACYPASLPDWYIFFATEQWNINLNSMKFAIQWGARYVRSTISQIQSALFPASNTEGIDNFKINFAANGAFMMVSNTLMLDVFSFFYQFQDRAGDVGNIINNVISAGFELGGGILNAPPPPEGSREAFKEWSNLEYKMVKYQKILTDELSAQAEKIINSGISTDQGIYGQLKNGTYLQPREAIYLPLVEDDLKNVTMAISLVQILRSMSAFVTVGSDLCTGDGINGAMADDDVLSYCDTNGTMYNIVRVKDGKYYDKFENAWVIYNRLGYSTQFLTNASISCQKKYGGFEKFPYNVTLPRDVMSDCIVNFPVCDLRNETIKRNKEKHGILNACRDAGLPI